MVFPIFLNVHVNKISMLHILYSTKSMFQLSSIMLMNFIPFKIITKMSLNDSPPPFLQTVTFLTSFENPFIRIISAFCFFLSNNLQRILKAYKLRSNGTIFARIRAQKADRRQTIKRNNTHFSTQLKSVKNCADNGNSHYMSQLLVTTLVM